MKFSITAEVEWDFDDDDPNFKWCLENATFVHKEACEFIVHIGDVNDDDANVSESTITGMRAAKCTEKFVAEYLDACTAGATRVLFWNGG